MNYCLHCSDEKPEIQSTYLGLASGCEQQKTPNSSYYVKKKDIYFTLILNNACKQAVWGSMMAPWNC